MGCVSLSSIKEKGMSSRIIGISRVSQATDFGSLSTGVPLQKHVASICEESSCPRHNSTPPLLNSLSVLSTVSLLSNVSTPFGEFSWNTIQVLSWWLGQEMKISPMGHSRSLLSHLPLRCVVWFWYTSRRSTVIYDNCDSMARSNLCVEKSSASNCWFGV